MDVSNNNAGTKVLIVDDKEDNIYMLESLLKGNGFNVSTALNGEEALKSATDNPPDLIISDILMPIMDGFTLCKKWKSNAILKKIPFVFYTATYTDAKDEEFARHLGADRFIVKPQEPEIFMKIINEMFNKLNRGMYSPPSKPLVDEEIQLREYNQALVRKLEDKMYQAEKSSKQLTALLVKYQAFFDHAPIAIFVIGHNQNIIESNGKAQEMFGYSKEEFQNLKIMALCPPELLDTQAELVKKTIIDGSLASTQVIRIKKDGTRFPVQITLAAIYNDVHKFEGIIGTIIDMSEQVNRERKIAEQLNELKQWYNVTLGREERVIELKKEVNSLLILLGKEKKYEEL